MNFLERMILNSSFVSKLENNGIRHLATFLSGAAAVWLLAHGGQQSDAVNAANGIFSLVLGIGGYGLSQFNKIMNGQAAFVSAQAGEPVTVQQVKQLVVGQHITLPSGKTVKAKPEDIIVGKRTPPNIPETDVTVALNKAQLPQSP